MYYVNIVHDDSGMICLNTKSPDQMIHFLKLLPLYFLHDAAFYGYITSCDSLFPNQSFNDFRDYLSYLEDLI